MEAQSESKLCKDMHFIIMKLEFEQLCDSMGKVRRRLFSELGEVKKMCTGLQLENQQLKTIIQEIRDDKAWTDGPECSVVDVREHQKIAS